jgi:hypothetical protein
MSLPRNLLAKNLQKNSKEKIIDKRINELNHICEKHHVGKLNFKECKLITTEGKQTILNHKIIKGNLRASVLLIYASDLFQNEAIYDIIQIEKEKNKREMEQKPNEISQGREMEQKPNETPQESSKEMKLSSPEHEKKHINKRQQIVNNFNKQLQEKNNLKNMNKYHRHFIRDLKNKFILHKKDEFKYFETKAETTFMVIDKLKVYQIDIPLKDTMKETYWLIVGDLKLKSAIIKDLDPSYKMDKIIEEQAEFMGKIKERTESTS